jgi:hypothetical protein
LKKGEPIRERLSDKLPRKKSMAWRQRNEDGGHQLGLHEREMRMEVTSLASMREK